MKRLSLIDINLSGDLFIISISFCLFSFSSVLLFVCFYLAECGLKWSWAGMQLGHVAVGLVEHWAEAAGVN